MSRKSGVLVLTVVAAGLLLPAIAAGDQAVPAPNNLGAATISAGAVSIFNDESRGMPRAAMVTIGIIAMAVGVVALAQSTPDGIVFVPETPIPTAPSH